MDEKEPRNYREEMISIAVRQRKATEAALTDIRQHGKITNPAFLGELSPKKPFWQEHKDPLTLKDLNGVIDMYSRLLAKVPERRDYDSRVKNTEYLCKIKKRLGKDYDLFFQLEGTMEQVFGYLPIGPRGGDPGRTLVADQWVERGKKR